MGVQTMIKEFLQYAKETYGQQLYIDKNRYESFEDLFKISIKKGNIMKIRLVHGDDWVGLYINDDCYLQDHKIELYDFMRLLQEIAPELTLTEIDYNEAWVDIDWLEDQGGYPNKYQDVHLVAEGR